MTDVLIVCDIGPPYSALTSSLGGSEYEHIQIADMLTTRGFTVAVANNRTDTLYERSVTYCPLQEAFKHWPTRALIISRFTRTPPGCGRLPLPPRIVIRVTDVAGPQHDHQARLMSEQFANCAVVGVSNWQLDESGPQKSGFRAREKIVIPPILGAAPASIEKVKKRFVFASAPGKGLRPTLRRWKSFWRKHPDIMRGSKLVVVTPGAHDFYGDHMPKLTDEDRACGVEFWGSPSIEAWRETIASAEGLFYVNAMVETWGGVCAWAERFGCRMHVLALAGLGGIPEAVVNHELLTTDEHTFEWQFLEALRADPPITAYITLPDEVPDYSADALAPRWMKAMQLA